MSDNKFHDHLDVCEQCREHPFDMCAEGWRIGNEEAKRVCGQESWEVALEDKLQKSAPTDVLRVLRLLRAWLTPYCAECGTYSDLHRGPPRCKCFREIVVG